MDFAWSLGYDCSGCSVFVDDLAVASLCCVGALLFVGVIDLSFAGLGVLHVFGVVVFDVVVVAAAAVAADVVAVVVVGLVALLPQAVLTEVLVVEVVQ